MTPKHLRTVRLRVLLALEAGRPILAWLALAIIATGIVAGSLAALEKSSDRLIALPAWLAVLTPLWLAYRHRLGRATMGLVGKPRWKARAVGGSVPPLDLDAIIEAERRKVMSQLPPREGNDPGQLFGREPGTVVRRPSVAEREGLERAVDDYLANLRVYLESRTPARLAGAGLWSGRVEWRHRGGQVLNNVQITLAFPTESFRLPEKSRDFLPLIKGTERPEQPVRPQLALQTGPHGVWYSIDTDPFKITRSTGGGSRFEAGRGLPQQLDLGATMAGALLRSDMVDQSDPHALRVIRTFERLRYGDRAWIEETLPIEATERGFHVVEWEILADELARPIVGRLLVEARAVTESGEPVTDLGAPAPDTAAGRRLSAATRQKPPRSEPGRRGEPSTSH